MDRFSPYIKLKFRGKSIGNHRLNLKCGSAQPKLTNIFINQYLGFLQPLQQPLDIGRQTPGALFI